MIPGCWIGAYRKGIGEREGGKVRKRRREAEGRIRERPGKRSDGKEGERRIREKGQREWADGRGWRPTRRKQIDRMN
jgi:hypothetical protein